jgi:hypothetical protein
MFFAPRGNSMKVASEFSTGIFIRKPRRNTGPARPVETFYWAVETSPPLISPASFCMFQIILSKNFCFAKGILLFFHCHAHDSVLHDFFPQNFQN